MATGASILSALIDLTVNVGVSGVLEGLVPQPSETENVWWGATLAFLEIGVHVGMSSALVMYSYDTFSIDGTLVPYGALAGIFLMTSAIDRLRRLVGYLRTGLRARAEAKIHAGDAGADADGDSK